MGIDPQRRELLRHLFLGVGVWSAGRVLPGCRSGVDPMQTAPRDAVQQPQAATATELTGREPLRYASGSPASTTPISPAVAAPPAPAATQGEGSAGANAIADAPLEPESLELGPLRAPDALGVQLPEGFVVREVARSGRLPIASGNYPWHEAPDGGATFAMPDGGWVYVSNSEIVGAGGVGALRFDRNGEIAAAYPILRGTTRNCAGGATPWGTWISCEEVSRGLCWECDPLGNRPAVVRPALGTFTHEAVAVDLESRRVYLTEDLPDGRLYRFTSSRVLDGGALDLESGTLEVLERQGSTAEGPVEWRVVPDPGATTVATRYQVPESTAFAGGEGIWFRDGMLFFTTKLDNRVWALDTDASELSVLYDAATHPAPTLTGVDNLSMSPSGHLLVAEDEGNMELALLDRDGNPRTLMRIVGQPGSELAGPAFNPAGDRLYVSSQRGQVSGHLGITYEIGGPFAALRL
jgi:hypothetical protein